MAILIVDDSATMRRVIMKTVTQATIELGIDTPEFLEAADGQAALDLVGEREDIQLVLCDITMPNMDGIEFVTHLRAQRTAEVVRGAITSVLKSRANSLPVVMVTTEGGLDRVYAALRAGANDYVKKPFAVADFTEKLVRYLDNDVAPAND